MNPFNYLTPKHRSCHVIINSSCNCTNNYILLNFKPMFKTNFPTNKLENATMALELNNVLALDRNADYCCYMSYCYFITSVVEWLSDIYINIYIFFYCFVVVPCLPPIAYETLL